MTTSSAPDREIKCACVSLDRRDCIRLRYPKFICDDCDDDLDYETEPCECACHDRNQWMDDDDF